LRRKTEKRKKRKKRKEALLHISFSVNMRISKYLQPKLEVYSKDKKEKAMQNMNWM
jgi:hypothetical protein